MPAAQAFHAFAVNEIACTAISDGTAHFSPAAFFANAPPDLPNAALIRHGLPVAPSARLETPLNCLLLRTAHSTALIDTGMGLSQ
jgi:hypothetical protein